MGFFKKKEQIATPAVCGKLFMVSIWLVDGIRFLGVVDTSKWFFTATL